MMMTSQVLDPSTFILRKVTSHEKLDCWRANGASWAGKLTIDDYISREIVNGSGDLTRDGGIRYWGFTAPPTDGGMGDQEIYAAVESIRKPVVMKTNEGGFSIEWSYGAASVFVPAQYRGKKIAAWMMRRLGEWFDGEEASCRFSVLYSDVGVYTTPHSITACILLISSCGS
jgi:GNAT superfamily N-acetyltransferase